jgi:hypothetical protein
MRTGMVKLSIHYRNLILFCLVAILACASLCKKKPQDNYLEPVNVSNNSGRSENPSIAVDSKGTLHLVWNDDTPGNEEIFYAFKSSSGIWSHPINLTNNNRASRFPSIAVDKNDVVHLAWQDASPEGRWKILYSQKTLDSNWSIPESLFGPGIDPVAPQLAIDTIGNIHMAYNIAYNPYRVDVFYTKKSPQSNWTSPISLNPTLEWPAIDFCIGVSEAGDVHVIWRASFIGNDSSYPSEIYYTQKPQGGNWISPINISNTYEESFSPSLAVDVNNVHVVWQDCEFSSPTGSELAYRHKSIAGEWDTIELIWPNDFGAGASNDFIITTDNELHLIWQDHIAIPRSGIFHVLRTTAGWSIPKLIYEIEEEYYGVSHLNFVADKEDKFHITYSQMKQADFEISNYDVYYSEYKYK